MARPILRQIKLPTKTYHFKNMQGIRILLCNAVDSQALENDSTFLIAGKLGKGKSTFALDAVHLIDGYKKQETEITNFAFSLPQFITALRKNYDKRSKAVIVLDEGRDLAGVNVITPLSRAMVKAFEVMRKASFITFICFSNPLRMQTYYSDDRIKGLFYVKKRGEVWFFHPNQLPQIREDLARQKTKSLGLFDTIKPRFKDTFPDYQGRLKEAYDRKKDQTIEDVLKELDEAYGLDEEVDPMQETFSPRQVAKALDVTSTTVKKYRNELGIPTKEKYTREEVDRFIAWKKAKLDKKIATGRIVGKLMKQGVASRMVEFKESSDA